jgi:hypothetical protein
MTEYSCSSCKYTSQIKEHVVRHINKKKSCGLGVKEIIEIPVEIICEFCNKNFSSIISLKYHVKNSCKHKDDALKQKIKELEKELRQAKSVTNNNITNNNTNNTTNYIIVLNNYEDTALDKLTDKTYNKILKDSESHQIIPRLIQKIHFDPETPENHNIYISNRGKNNKHLQVYRNGHWEIADKNTEISNIISDKETNLSDWVAEKGKNYPDAQEIFNEYLDQKFDDETAKLMKEEVELLLYNNRGMVRNNQKLVPG